MSRKETFNVTTPRAPSVPILLSVPHCGTDFPEEVSGHYDPRLIKSPDDTDWFVDRLYDFAPDLGITLISARVSRWVIDLNRDPEEKPLYHDGRLITGLCPTTTFLGESLYKDKRTSVEKGEVQRRLEAYYKPYHIAISEILDNMVAASGRALLWDCHSIRQEVPTIHKGKFPDLILGDADGTSASPGLIEAALGVLDHSTYQTRHNFPFKGGYITRHFGKPAANRHALQLEMTKVNYMDASEKVYDVAKADEMKGLLKNVFLKLIEQL
ncbi:MAG: N-formylglutamate amidohydrolase [Cytophagales bacterium]|nr:N-formylglutamate amidohydrolase [Cytophagales bacterium]